MAEDDHSSDRHLTILNSVERLVSVFDAWQQDTATFAIKPHSSLDQAIENAIVTTCYGDIPEQSRGLEVAVGRLRLAYEDYQGGDYREKTKEPMPSFYAAMRAVSDALKAIKVDTQKIVIESVAELRKQGLDYDQVARAYGAFDEGRERWIGPFFDSYGKAIPALIDQEAATPKSVIGSDFVHPLAQIADIQRERRIADQARRFDDRVETSKSEEARKIKPKPTRETVLQLLSEKLFPRQIMLDYDITEPEIDAIAMSAGIAVEGQPKTSIHPQSQEPTQEQPLAAVPANAQTEKPLAERLKERVAEIMQDSPDATSNDIAETLSDELGQVVKPASVNAIMTNIKRRQQQPPA